MKEFLFMFLMEVYFVVIFIPLIILRYLSFYIFYVCFRIHTVGFLKLGKVYTRFLPNKFDDVDDRLYNRLYDLHNYLAGDEWKKVYYGDDSDEVGS